ncbi:conjugal transfer protein TraF [candidate division KSB1 bacterium]|nr:conjugal transfer protein TraF [candidate division KSB1 bacterium]NIR70108.1 conjugal transfer protein TraF [candidate division KSB1 bacterium]NIS27533.1 conjugal transfer protein TraF [candidate division KSB1 bacterium]NIT74384.1 conjugal transfer protein TraF [candidate division KSB1 bacterium]NIU28251.1 conjugal transfer protein TraF [candidate division KSB1 bacterium]
MERRKVGLACVLTLFVLTIRPAFSQEKLAQTGFQFLSVGTDARATALGEAVTTVEGSPMNLFYNPAGMAGVESFLQFSANHLQWLVDIDYYSGALSINPEHGRYGVFGLSFLFVDYGTIIGTVVAATEQGFVETGKIEPNAFAIGLGYSKALSDRFSVGGHLKFVKQALGNLAFPESDTTLSAVNFSESAVAIDFGTIYKTGFKSLTFGMTIRNFSREINYISEDFELPLTFKIGFSINTFDFLGESQNQSLVMSFDAVNPRSLEEFFSIGGEYTFMDVLSLRAGYVANQDEYALTAGFGINAYKMHLDYSYTPFDSFEDIHRFSAKFKL